MEEEKLERAKARREILWNVCLNWREDDRIAHLVAYCIWMCGGDAKTGAMLATEAIWL